MSPWSFYFISGLFYFRRIQFNLLFCLFSPSRFLVVFWRALSDMTSTRVIITNSINLIKKSNPYHWPRVNSNQMKFANLVSTWLQQFVLRVPNRCKLSGSPGGLSAVWLPSFIYDWKAITVGCIRDTKMTLEICRAFHGVYTFHSLIVVTWLGLQGKGAGHMANSQSFDVVNATKATATEQPKEMVTSPTEEPYNYTLGTKQ